jgi:hypothetical protein
MSEKRETSEGAREPLLEAKLRAIVRWLEANQEDVFRRGLWDAIYEAEHLAAPATTSEGARGYEKPAFHGPECDCIRCGGSAAARNAASGEPFRSPMESGKDEIIMNGVRYVREAKPGNVAPTHTTANGTALNFESEAEFIDSRRAPSEPQGDLALSELEDLFYEAFTENSEALSDPNATTLGQRCTKWAARLRSEIARVQGRESK